MNKLNQLRNKNLGLILKDILQDGLLGLHCGTPGVNDTTYPAWYLRLILKQNALGWDQLYCGHWVIEWDSLHQAYARRWYVWKERDKNGQGWVVCHGQLLIKQWLQLWEHHNEECHGADKEEKRRKHFQILRDKLDSVYKMREKVIPSDCHLFYSSAEDHICKHTSLDLIEDWIHTHCRAVDLSAKQATQHGIAITILKTFL